MVFIRKHRRKGKSYYSVVETFREKGKIMQRILHYIGSEKCYSKFLQDTISMQKIFYSEIENLSYQAPLALWKLTQELEIPKIFSKNFKKEWGVNAGLASTIMILNYALESRSKNKLSDWYGQTYLKYLIGIKPEKLNSDLLYRTLDFFSEERIEEMHEEIFTNAKEKFNLSDDITLYDVTAILFEGSNCSLAKRGYNSEALYKLQANLGLAVTSEKFPIIHKTFEGNTKDVTTFDKILVLLNKTINLEKTTFILDRGLFSDINIQKIVDSKSSYILGMPKNSTIKKLILEVKDEQFQKADEFTSFYEVAREKRTIIFWNKEMAKEQNTEREKRLRIIEKKLKELNPRKYVKERLYEKVGQIAGKYRKFFKIDYGSFSISFNEKEIEKAKVLDGKSAIVTNTNLEAVEVLKRYRDRNFIEMSFKDLKLFVDIRPVRHWKQNRVLAHIFLAVLAFGVRSLLELRLRKSGLEITAQESLEKLTKVRVLCSSGKIIKVTGEDEETKNIAERLSLMG